MLRIGSLFSGVGGLELGLERALDARTLWQVEKEPFCREVLARHWPDAARHRDVRAVGAHNLAPVDLVCGGCPCQPFSLAGKRRGDRDERHLWPEFARVVSELRPRYVVFENVPGLFAWDGGSVFRGILGDLAALGYDALWTFVRAADVEAPQQRERLFLLGWRIAGGGDRVAGADREGLPFGSRERDDVREEQPPAARGGGARTRARRGRAEGLGQTESELGRALDGLPAGVDGRALADAARGIPRTQAAPREEKAFPGWPAPPGQPQRPYEPPRTCVRGAQSRKHRLMALGNAVVPQVAYEVGLLLRELIERLP
jgi:DNA (cytosine-5)-methyltransferase 1